ncbi:pyridoxamine 5'-phosphate oxidase family protein [Actinomycetospora termitidis]|uniref:Pyridoxamine 5'-phosphate oxidase family protein n=1 Tax=Actinomycetospora termitidis TaxID=3053470 RepID=A0ABT7M927_9PSEU|nr:pyridoxamine 5'-phosphate oxidase family protein [Actinomycetospora sp. Odt1-22]MDL5155923.1 pyridoxamine 5'-phosphate oxidase family protein [Actinomycetospora sp. Odt1-22]
MLSPTPRTELRRKRDRQQTDPTSLHAILDEALVCHLGLVDPDGAPLVLPTMHARVADVVYVHGSSGAASLALDREVCLTVTLLDGLVLARSVFNHSANYRSAVVRGRARRVTDPAEQLRALEAIVEHLTPGQWDHAARPDRKESAATAVLALDLAEASVKVRQGPPGDPERVAQGDRRWAGVVPITTVLGEPETCPALPADVAVPEHVRERRRA